MTLVKYQAKLLWFQAFTGWEPVLDEPGEAEVFKAADVERVLTRFLPLIVDCTVPSVADVAEAKRLLAQLEGRRE